MLAEDHYRQQDGDDGLSVPMVAFAATEILCSAAFSMKEGSTVAPTASSGP